MDVSKEIWLVRHGETPWSITGQHTGRENLPLTANGEREALATAELLRGVQFDEVLCSPLQRAQRTCELCGLLGRARLEPNAMEWDYGQWNGLTRAQIRAQIPGWIIWNGPIPGGESLDDVAARARLVLAGLDPHARRTILFAHGHLLRILTTQYLGLPAAAAAHFALSTGAVSILGFDYGLPALLKWNATAL